MKTIFLTFVCALAALQATAQSWVAGEMSLTLSSTKLDRYDMNAGNQFKICPEAGFFLSEKVALAVRLNYAHYDNAEAKMIDQTAFGNYNQYGIEPFVRYVFFSKDRVQLFADGGLFYDALAKSNYDGTLHTVGAGVQAGANFALTDRFGLTAHMGRLAYSHSWMRQNGLTLKNNTLGFELLESLSFGAYLNL